MSKKIQNEMRFNIANKLEARYMEYTNIHYLDNDTKNLLATISQEIKDGKNIATEFADENERKIREDVCSMLKEFIDKKEMNFHAKYDIVQQIIQLPNQLKENQTFEKHSIFSKLQTFMKFAYGVLKKVFKWGGAVILLTLIVGMISEMFNPETSPTSSEHRQNYDQSLQEYFPFQYETLSFLGSQMEVPDSDRKVITLIIASDNDKKTEKFLQTFIPLTKKYFPFFTFAEFVSSKKVLRQELFSFASKKTAEKNDGKIILVIKNIDFLEGEAPLALQSIAEVDDPRFRKTFAIFTVTLDEEFTFEQNCKELIRRHIENSWSSNNLPDGKLAAIMSRISEDCICLS
uniref:Uncharacterized protein n=1 Tax=Panagrolaimus sp. ES5 TaxID=591445 RepID=A0AC34EZU0_9BILA